MALANVAFLAACNGLRVLAMDWDLEAPGLVYYFKGLRDSAAATEVRAAPGVLNLLWEWVGSMKEARTEKDVAALMGKFARGLPFEQCLREVCDPAFFSEGCLHFIGAGSPRIETPLSIDYEEALTKFPWHEFFDEMAGGYVAQSLRTWAKSRYDLILIDSRTGLAEAAGLCTMQLPDSVVLCFILNRQNIDGVARISGAVRQRRGTEVGLLAAPMRVGRQETSEESDARARAIAELTRIGGFQADAAQQQLRSLAITQTDGVPFYETLAPIAADDPRLDALTLNYLKLGSEIVGRPLDVVEIDPELSARVRARLQPRHATVEYVTKLAGGEPVRVVEELRRLLDSAIELALDRAIVDDSYVKALVSASFAVSEPAYYEDVVELQRLAIDLLRVLYQRDDTWTAQLAEAIELYCATSSPMLESEEEIALRDELDTLLSHGSPIVFRARRVTNRRRSAWLHYYEKQFEAANQAVGEVFAWIKEIRSEQNNLSADSLEELLTAEADMRLLRGHIAERNGNMSAAADSYMSVVHLLSQADSETVRIKPEARRIHAEAHVRMALLEAADISDLARREHAIEAARLGSSLAVAARFSELVALFLASGRGQDQLVEFTEQAIGMGVRSQRTLPASYFGRSPRQALAFLETANQIVAILLSRPSQKGLAVVDRLVQLAEAVLVQAGRRRVTLGSKAGADLLRQFELLVRTTGEAGVRWTPGDETRLILSGLGPRSPRREAT